VKPASFGAWSVLASYSHTDANTERGFLTSLSDPLFDAQGFRTKTQQDDLYLDAHTEIRSVAKFEFVFGADYLMGDGSSRGGDYDYQVAADGSGAPRAGSIPLNSDIRIDVTRNYGGVYGYAAWQAAPRLRLDAGLRWNLVDESRDTYAEEFGDEPERGTDNASQSRLSGSAGAVFTAWSDGIDDLKFFASYRNTFKPAAVDFGLEAEPEILEPETGESYEIGARGAFLDGRLEFELDAFQMNLKNLVVPTDVNGLPALENVGEERFRGVELEVRGKLAENLLARAAWSLHDARFQDYLRDFDGVPTQLEGNRQEMTPRDLGAVGLVWAPPVGLVAHVDVRYTGDRYLNKRNTALADGFTSWSAGLGWRAEHWQVRLDGENLSDRRDPVAESELADASYYRLEGRRVWLTFEWQR
jgi:iron complex outermembrane receptor protein